MHLFLPNANSHVGVHDADSAYKNAVIYTRDFDSDLAMAWRTFEHKAYFFLF
jgi:hypothetical protein